MDIIPHFYSVGNEPRDDGDGMNNLRLRVGEVQAIYYPDDPRNFSRLFTEYQVFVSHRANGTGTTKMYVGVAAADAFGGAADTATQTYRADTSASRKSSGPGLGSKVLVLCINGESVNAVILGGLRDPKGPRDSREDGHHLRRRFNGVDLTVNNDGEFELTYLGADKADGTPRDDVDQDAVGTTVKISKNGNFEVADAGGKNSVLVDHENGKVIVTSESEVVATASKVTLTSGGDTQPALRGDDWRGLMSDLLDALTALTVGTPMGPSSPPLNAAQLVAIKARLGEPLSDAVFVG